MVLTQTYLGLIHGPMLKFIVLWPISLNHRSNGSVLLMQLRCRPLLLLYVIFFNNKHAHIINVRLSLLNVLKATSILGEKLFFVILPCHQPVLDGFNQLFNFHSVVDYIVDRLTKHHNDRKGICDRLTKKNLKC